MSKLKEQIVRLKLLATRLLNSLPKLLVLLYLISQVKLLLMCFLTFHAKLWATHFLILLVKLTLTASLIALVKLTMLHFLISLVKHLHTWLTYLAKLQYLSLIIKVRQWLKKREKCSIKPLKIPFNKTSHHQGRSKRCKESLSRVQHSLS